MCSLKDFSAVIYTALCQVLIVNPTCCVYFELLFPYGSGLDQDLGGLPADRVSGLWMTLLVVRGLSMGLRSKSLS